MNHHGILLFLAFVFFIQSWPELASAQTRCVNNGNYTQNSTYAANLNATFSLLFRDVTDSGFANASVGDGVDRAYAAVLCRGDRQLGECRSCIQESRDELLRSCPNRKQAVMWDERCMLRYSNATIYGAMTTSPMHFWWNNGNASSPDQFEEAVSDVLARLRDEAADGDSLRKVAAMNATAPDFKTIFALVQCTPDLSKTDCTRCLVAAYGNIQAACAGKQGCRVLTPSCNLRFAIYPFYNESRLQELEVVPPSPPPSLPLPLSPPPSSSSSSGKGDGNTTRTVIIIVVPIVLGLLLTVSAFIWLRKRKTQRLPEVHYEDVDEIITEESLQYAFSTIKVATDNFSDHNKLGQGGFGAVYKGKLPNGLEIAVKRLSMNSGQGDLEFKNEVLLLAKLQHRNLVRLLGFAIEGMEKLLIYELVQNASLDHFIFDETNRSNLDWDRRYKIIGGIARGILYLHEDSRLRIIHRDLKASNILLDGEMIPKIADFGMAKLFEQDETQGNTNRIAGTYGYMPPEYVLHGQFSIKSDVFSFGVLVLEIISGLKNSNLRSGDNVGNLLSFTWKNWCQETTVNVVDPSLRSGSGSISEMLRCIHIGLLCVQKDAAERPTMASVVIMLSSSSMRLDLPSEPAFYFPSSSASDLSRIEDLESREPQREAGQSDHSSKNDVSITELYPR